MEGFTDIKGYEGLYSINKNGDVYSYKRDKFLTPTAYKNRSAEHNYVALSKNGKKYKPRIHKLIKQTFTEKKELVGFKKIKGYEESYLINIKGDIYSNYTGKFLSPAVGKIGYWVVALRNKTHYLHRLIAEHFIPNPDERPCINHKDGNKANNSIDNLEWCTHRENIIHAAKTGLMNYQNCEKKIICITTGKSFKSIKEAVGQMGIPRKSIYNVLSGKVKATHGYRFRYL